ncbi:MAG: thioredoxin [Planctomycetes bacterium]|nr:thioredoxin [Planctomycetota bacterium]
MDEHKSEWIFSVTERDFNARVLERSKQTPVVVDFWASWCGPCQMLAPILEKLVEKRAGAVLLAKVNTDEEQRLAMDFGIQSLPTVVAFKNGQVVLDFIGLLPENKVDEFLNRIGPSEADKKAQQASELEKTNPAQAEKLYRQVLQKEPNQEESLLGLARLLVDQNKEGEANELLERVGPGGEHGAEAEKLSAILWLRRHAHDRGDEKTLKARLEHDPGNPTTLYDLGCVEAAAGRYAEALRLLLDAAQRDKKLAAAKVREAMVKVFQVIGVRSELADEYRDKLTALLY